MLSRIVSSTIKKLVDAHNTGNHQQSDGAYPTLPFPPPPPAGPGTRRLCPRCLTLLYHRIITFGDGTACENLEMPHSLAMSMLSGSPCVICAKLLLLFDGMQKHVSFEETLRRSPLVEWRLTCKFEAPPTVSWHRFSQQAARVSFMVKHKGGYSWGIGSFMLHPDSRVPLPVAERKTLMEDYGTILSLDGQDTAFGSTLSSESMAKAAGWMQECYATHTKCHRLFGKDGPNQPVTPWFPDRLIRITRTDKSGPAWLSTRLVLKSSPADFPAAMTKEALEYLSFSHCWGPEPEGGRGGQVLTKDTIEAWRKELPLDKMPLAFQHAVKVCASLGFDHIWIDSLCILQDNVQDWQEQSAVMADVYKFAWLNIAALSTSSDCEGFINDARDPRVIWGFKTHFAHILGTGPATTWNHQGRPCVLLTGEATLLWDIQRDLPGGGDWLAPLFTRAWVYQERSLARRVLAFATHGVFFACDEAHHGENPNGLDGVCTSGSGPRHLLHSIADTSAKLATETLATGALPSAARLQQEAIDLLRRFGSAWNGAVMDYTKCKLTKDSDRLIAISAVARELANSGAPQQQRYLAGLWDINLIFQLGWMACEGRTTLRRKHAGTKGYVAPSWSWASIEAPIAKCGSLYPDESVVRALADVRAAQVELATEFAYGPVKAGWLRLWGCLRAVSGSHTKPNYDYEGSSVSTSLTDAATGEKLWFASDTAEGYEIVSSRTGLRKVVWVPHMLNMHSSMVNCYALVLAEVSPDEGFAVGGDFVRPGEQVYRRLGTGDFGRIPSLFRQDKLVMSLGAFPEATEMTDVLRGFGRNEAGYREFVII
ncbi:heterokaryon incompatibility protein-domain-containing protein [Cladorrhinum sp. PSN332]|nr:heterokaryon incompatibility protein-domain-containing protein [Cladorrhinum sp. PSN332]